MTQEQFQNTMKFDAAMVEKGIHRYLDEELNNAEIGILNDAIQYAMFAGGKHLRAIVCMEMCYACGKPKEKAMAPAVSLELIQTASCVEDDLPCMDNSPMRRGKPSLHLAYNEYIALLATNAMYGMSHQVLMRSDISHGQLLKLMNCLSDATGLEGLVGGQLLDLQNENKRMTAEQLIRIYEGKTTPLFVCASEMGAIMGGANASKMQAAHDYGSNLGTAFQIIDDILDVTQSSEIMMKPTGLDAENDKQTLPSIMGLEASKQLAHDYTEKAIAALAPFGAKAFFLKELARYMENRIY